jgi:hypothetical protein
MCELVNGDLAFLIDDAASGEAQNTSWRHLSSIDVAPRKISCTFFYRIYPKENIAYTGVLQVVQRKTDEISRTLRLMFIPSWFDARWYMYKLWQNPTKTSGLIGWNWGQELTENKTLENREFGLNARSATSRFSLAGSSLQQVCAICIIGLRCTRFCWSHIHEALATLRPRKSFVRQPVNKRVYRPNNRFAGRKVARASWIWLNSNLPRIRMYLTK